MITNFILMFNTKKRNATKGENLAGKCYLKNVKHSTV